MQITLSLDEALLNEALQLTNLTTQEELIKLALQELVRSRRKKNLLNLAGKIQFALTLYPNLVSISAIFCRCSP